MFGLGLQECVILAVVACLLFAPMHDTTSPSVRMVENRTLRRKLALERLTHLWLIKKRSPQPITSRTRLLLFALIVAVLVATIVVVAGP